MELAAAGVGSSYGNSRYQEEQQQHQVQVQVAPFVAKTYQMVDDPSTDWLIRWGKARNSFLVLDPVRFSQLLLPTYFKHANFSSFVRQLNTYGFRKVDFDRWEFAHESFLQGQTHLLRAITRRKKHGPLPRRASSHLADADTITNELVPAIDIDRTTSTAAAHHHHGTTAMVVTGEADLFGYDDKEEKLLLRELSRLKREQRELDAELVRMSHRLHDTEGRPQQMMALLTRAVEDPDVLSRLMVARDKYTDVVNRTPLEAQQHQPAADSDHTTPPCHWKPAAPPSGITTSLEARYYGVWDSDVPHAEEYGAPPTQLSAASFDRARVHLDGNYYVTTAVVPPLGVTATAPGFDRNQLSSEAHFPASTQAFDLPSFPLDLSHNITTQTHHSISPIPNQSLLLPSFPLDLSHNRLYHQ